MLQRQSLMLFETDEAMRKLERKVSTGDGEAVAKLNLMRRRLEVHPEGDAWADEMRGLHWHHGGSAYSTQQPARVGPHRYAGWQYHTSGFKNREDAERFRDAAPKVHPDVQVSEIRSHPYHGPHTVDTALRHKKYRDSDPEE